MQKNNNALNNDTSKYEIKNPSYSSKKKSKIANLESFAPKLHTDSSVVYDDDKNGNGLHRSISHGVDFSVVYNNEKQLIQQYRNLSMNSEIRSAVMDIVNEAIVMDTDKPPVILDLNNVDDSVLKDKVKEQIIEEFEYVLRLLKFRHEGDSIFERFYIDGRLGFHKIIDPKKPREGLKDLREIDPINLKKVTEIKREAEKNNKEHSTVVDHEDYYLYIKDANSGKALKIPNSAISYVTSGIFDHTFYKGSNKKVVISHLHQVLKPFNQLNQLKDAHLIYTISRAPQRRVFYIDTGKLSQTRAESYMQQNMNRYKNKMVYDSSTGKISNNRHTLSMMEDIWLPRKGGDRGTEIDLLAGGGTLGDLDLVDIFRSELNKSLQLPNSRLEQDSVQALGRTSEITRDEVKFQKFIDKLRNRFSKIFIDIMYTQLILKNIVTIEEWNEFKDDINFIFSNDSYFSELKEIEMLRERFQMVESIDPDGQYVGKYFSEEYIRKIVLRQSDKDIETIKKQIEDESKDSDSDDSDDFDDIDDRDFDDSELKHKQNIELLDRKHQHAMELKDLQDKEKSNDTDKNSEKNKVEKND